MIEETLISSLLNKFPELDLSWPDAKIRAWATALGLILHGRAPAPTKLTALVVSEPKARRPQRQKPARTAKAAPVTRSEAASKAATARWAKAKAAAEDPAPAKKAGKPAGAAMCPGCHKMIKPVHLSVKVNDRPWHAECAPEE